MKINKNLNKYFLYSVMRERESRAEVKVPVRLFVQFKCIIIMMVVVYIYFGIYI